MKRMAMLCLVAWLSAPVALSQGLLESALTGKATIVDLTHKLSSAIPYWPGPAYKPFHFETIATLEKDGVYSGAFCMAEHMGTHVDAPNHFEAGQASIDALPLQHLIAPAAVIDVRQQVARDPDYRLTVDDLKRWEKKHGRVPRNALVCLYTGWDARWSDPIAYRHQDEQQVMHFPGFSAEVAEFLVTQRHIRGIGIDTLSVDYGPSKDFIVHHIMNRAGKYHLENLANLGRLPATGAVIIAAPIPIDNGSGAPARVFAIVRRSP
ncbi:MAG: cyclase family protein [Acidobacteriota bacterium]|nr:cyclase family protein [Blastocatellia bacterium]MDW8240701.1 cyclase family protein [Acidobacteriota bacterium]